ncbi:hypothetical protein B0H63DRAFT_519145 [Podospora didyma]|uniref:Uncharacterized protein n=1 Tax=Podospora didyma TaxID=330526 RepID=A0AAE0NYF4_9PEZI|nr:hypothetical protein B0H63DRAFT_519145 [Podospora didyma]
MAVTSAATETPMPTPLALLGPSAAVNLLHMKLFHHFSYHTIHTLHLGPEFWEEAVRMSVEIPCLMNMALCLFHGNFCQKSSSFTLDAFVAIGGLLQYELWACVDFALVDNDKGVHYSPSRDRLFVMGSGMLKIIVDGAPMCDLGQALAVFSRLHISYSPRHRLRERAQLKKCANSFFQTYFSHDEPLTAKHLSAQLCTVFDQQRQTGEATNDSDITTEEDFIGQASPIASKYCHVVARLALILSFLPEAGWVGTESPNTSVMSDLSRFIVSFPSFTYQVFLGIGYRRSPKELLFFYHFCRAASILLRLVDECAKNPVVQIEAGGFPTVGRVGSQGQLSVTDT